MNPELLFKISRKGVEISPAITITELGRWIKLQIVLKTDHYWQEGMADWKLVSEIAEEALKSYEDYMLHRREIDARKSAAEWDNFLERVKRIILPIIFFGIGVIVLLNAVFSNPNGAIQQNVLAVHMTNGILLMILGAIFYTKK